MHEGNCLWLDALSFGLTRVVAPKPWVGLCPVKPRSCPTLELRRWIHPRGHSPFPDTSLALFLPVESQKSGSLSSFCPISVRQMSVQVVGIYAEMVDGIHKTQPSFFTNGCPATPLVFSPEHAFSLFTIWISWEFPNLQVLVPFCLTVLSV